MCKDSSEKEMCIFTELISWIFRLYLNRKDPEINHYSFAETAKLMVPSDFKHSSVPYYLCNRWCVTVYSKYIKLNCFFKLTLHQSVPLGYKAVWGHCVDSLL